MCLPIIHFFIFFSQFNPLAPTPTQIRLRQKKLKQVWIKLNVCGRKNHLHNTTFLSLYFEFYVNTVKCLYGVSVASDGQGGDLRPLTSSPGRPLT